jgi:hypothetical protein
VNRQGARTSGAILLPARFAASGVLGDCRLGYHHGRSPNSTRALDNDAREGEEPSDPCPSRGSTQPRISWRDLRRPHGKPSDLRALTGEAPRRSSQPSLADVGGVWPTGPCERARSHARTLVS